MKVGIFLFVLCCHAVGLLLFCKGFLLKRVVLPNHAKCSDSADSVSHHHYNNVTSCNTFSRPFRRVVWLLIDALRYDFILYDETLESPPVYRNKMPFVRDLLRSQPANARLFKFVADPPTTTMQRLKALTTGSLPTFIDVGSNFNSYAVSEDSLPLQAMQNGRNVTFIGDDTWLGLYPDMMSKTFDYPSLNVKDLDTVDNGVIEHLVPELKEHDADMIIGHMLGVDHVGHTYGPSHWTMGKKLTQMNEFLEDLFSYLDEETLLFVFGDHGMTPTGDHGGETALETDAALLVYSPRPLFDPSESPLGREVYQIDLVPTVAMVLGLPIPFSNLGMIIPEVLLPFEKGGDGGSEGGYKGRVTLEFLKALRINTEQIHSYLVEYVQHSGDFPPDALSVFEKAYSDTVKLHQELLERAVNQPPSSQQHLTYVADKYVEYMKEVKRMCNRVWAKFDDFPIFLGAGFLLFSVATLPLVLLDINRAVSSLYRSFSLGFGTGLPLSGILVFYTGVDYTTAIGLLELLVNVLLVTLTLINIIFLWQFGKGIAIKSLKTLLSGGQWLFPSGDIFLCALALVIAALYAVSMLSNSFVLYEADMSAFFIQTLVFGFAVKALGEELAGNGSSRGRGSLSLLKTVFPHASLAVCVRISKLFYACRDLQIQDGCESTTFLLAMTSASDFLGSTGALRFAASSSVVFLVPTGLVILLKDSRYRKFLSWHLVMVYKFGLPLSSACVVVHWTLQLLPEASLTHWQHLAAPWTVLLITAVTIAVCVLCPFRKPATSCDGAEVDDTSTARDLDMADHNEQASNNDSNLVSRWRKWPQGTTIATTVPALTGEHSVDVPTAPLVTMVVSVLLTALWVLIAMLLNDGIALSAAITAAEMFLVTKIVQHYKKGISWEVYVLWGLLSSHSFFSFGHHATVTSLRFDAAFVGIHGEVTKYNLPLAASLVGLNTLASQVLFGLGLPLLLSHEVREKNKSSDDQLLSAMVMYITFNALKLLVAVMAASLHRRHLMVWWVFAPRFLYEGAFQATTDVTVILSCCILKRLYRKSRQTLT